VKKLRKLPLHAITRSAHFKIVQDLPAHIYEGIGRIISAHGVLETQVADLLFDLAEIDFSVGRVAFRYQAASERFKTIKRLMVLHGLDAPTLSLNELEKQITDCCNARDQFAHGVWIQAPNGRLALRITKGEFETDEGTVDRAFVPEARFVPDDYYEETRKIILITAAAVNRLRQDLGATLRSRRASP
jgi:hypothetical protein